MLWGERRGFGTFGARAAPAPGRAIDVLRNVSQIYDEESEPVEMRIDLEKPGYAPS
jgi:hypothetical protein